MPQNRTVFPDLIGNQTIRDTLSADLAAGKNAHAYILEGPAGSGKHTAAYAICAAALCEHRLDPSVPLPCGQCPSCRKILGHLSVDILTVSNGEKASIGVDAIRAVRESLYITPNDGDKKFYIIEKAHLMTVQAQNALLLSLEEPPPYVGFLLLCEDASLLLETIRSRAPVLKMERFQPDFLEQYLLRAVPEAGHDTVIRAARLAGGSLGQARALCEHGEEELKLYETAAGLVRCLLDTPKSEALVFIAKSMPKERKQTRDVLALTRTALRDVLADKKGGHLLFYREQDGIPAYARKTSARRVLSLYAALGRAADDLASNVSQTAVLTALVMNA